MQQNQYYKKFFHQQSKHKMKLNQLKTPLILIMMMVVVYSCNSWDDGWQKPPKDVQGYKPVYMPKAAAYTVGKEAPRSLEKPGKIYTYGGLLFVVEQLKGIHVINNQDPANPLTIAFLNIPGCNDVAVNAGMLYADNMTDLVVFDITDPMSITYKKRIAGQFPDGIKLYPEEARDQYFECVDTTKGVVVGWELTTLNDPKCYR
jgi:hypothetical protein